MSLCLGVGESVQSYLFLTFPGCVALGKQLHASNFSFLISWMGVVMLISYVSDEDGMK